MKESDKVFAGSVPALYERYLGPLIFKPYALDMAERVAAAGASRILEIAAGTGIVSRAMAARLPNSSILATDLNQPMLDHAARKPGLERVRFQQADALGRVPGQLGGSSRGTSGFEPRIGKDIVRQGGLRGERLVIEANRIAITPRQQADDGELSATVWGDLLFAGEHIA